MHPRAIANAIGVVVAAVGGVMIVPAIFSFFDGTQGTTVSFFIPTVVSVIGGGGTFLLTRKEEQGYISIRDVFLIVFSGWILVTILGAVPFVLSGTLGPVDAFFDSMAGFTTTGASTIETPEEVASSLLLWRSMTQWAGGIGIIVLFVAIAPLVGFGATQLYAAEMPNPVQERLTPRIQDTAKVLTSIYFTLTAGGIIMLLFAGMDFFDAINHALTTVSTGGFSTRSDSIAAYDSWPIEAVILVGMVLSGANFGLYFLAVQGRLGRAFRSPELLAYFGIIATATVVTTFSLYFFDYQDSLLMAFRQASFQSASLSTGTAFQTADWRVWDPLSTGVLILLMFIGGCAGSTSGGIKVVRAVVLVKNAAQDSVRLLHPRAVTTLRLGDRVVSERLRQTVLGFVFVYVMTLAIGTLVLAAHQVPLGHAFGAVFACLNITGTALGPVGDPAFYDTLPSTAKLSLSFFMLLGRLELLSVLILLTPAFWQRA